MIFAINFHKISDEILVKYHKTINLFWNWTHKLAQVGDDYFNMESIKNCYTLGTSTEINYLEHVQAWPQQ